MVFIPTVENEMDGDFPPEQLFQRQSKALDQYRVRNERIDKLAPESLPTPKGKSPQQPVTPYGDAAILASLIDGSIKNTQKLVNDVTNVSDEVISQANGTTLPLTTASRNSPSSSIRWDHPSDSLRNSWD